MNQHWHVRVVSGSSWRPALPVPRLHLKKIARTGEKREPCYFHSHPNYTCKWGDKCRRSHSRTFTSAELASTPPPSRHPSASPAPSTGGRKGTKGKGESKGKGKQNVRLPVNPKVGVAVSLAAHATTLTVHTNIGVTVSLAALVKALTVRTLTQTRWPWTRSRSASSDDAL